MTLMEQLTDMLGDIPTITNEKAVRAKSRDFFWYSPVLKEKLDHVTGDIVVCPRTEEDVIATLAACYALDLPVTPRGGGTGNYGQAMPLAGGVVLDMSRMNSILSLENGVAVVEPGALIADIDAAAREAHGQELRMHPSTRETATIGGFIAGGSGGIGSIRWGMLWEPGNILSLRVVTMEERPRVLTITGAEINQFHHAYGVTGIITKIEMPLAPAPEWVDMIVGIRDWKDTLEFGWMLAGCEGIWLKELAAIQAPAPWKYFGRHQKFLQEHNNALCIMVAPNSADALAELAATHGHTVSFRADKTPAEALKGLPHIYHLGWNHTTLRGLRTEPEITYLQVGLPEGREVAACLDMAEKFPDDLVNHIEFTRGQGVKRMSSLPLVRFTTKDRLQEIIASLEQMGCPVWNPHVYTLEEGNRRDADPTQIELKRENDPKGLLNPGKMIGWHDPEYTFSLGSAYDFWSEEPPKQ